MNNTIVNGGDLMLFCEDQNGNMNTLGFATSHKLTINSEAQEISTKDHGKWSSKVPKKITWSITSENLYATNANARQKNFYDLYNIFKEGTKIKVKFSQKQPQTGEEIPDRDGWNPVDQTFANNLNKTYHYLEGTAIISSLEVNAPDGDTATFTVQLEGCGKLTHGKFDPDAAKTTSTTKA